MSRSARALLGLGALLCAASLGFWLAPRAAQAQPARPGWEYRVLQLDEDSYEKTREYKAILERFGLSAVEGAFHEHALNLMGREGWELVNYDRRRPGLTYLYLKRPRD